MQTADVAETKMPSKAELRDQLDRAQGIAAALDASIQQLAGALNRLCGVEPRADDSEKLAESQDGFIDEFRQYNNRLGSLVEELKGQVSRINKAI